MPKVDVLNLDARKVGEIDLADEVFAAEVKEHLFWEVVKAQTASQRQGTAATKGRSQVSGGGQKPWRQKGTGRARQGSTRSVQWVGGGRAFPRIPYEPDYRVPRKVRKAAMRSALSLKLREGKLTVLDGLTLSAPKTRELAAALKRLKVGKALVLDAPNVNARLAARNLPSVSFLPVEGFGLMDVLQYDHLVLTRPAAEKLNGAYKP
jgi:large subunit ribosomal protein L4